MSEYTLHEYTRRGFTIRIKLDPEPGNPRTEYDNLAKFICFHGRYELGDKHEYSSEKFIRRSGPIMTRP